jgi:hypothetical protein
MFLGCSLITIHCSTAAAQSPANSTETEVWPEIDAHVQLPLGLRMLSFVGVEQGVGYPFQQWYGAIGLGYQFKPILRPHWMNIDQDKEHYLLFGVGYEYLRTTQSGKVFDENRITFDLTPSLRLASRLLVRDRNWVELRWINGIYSTTYRNMPFLQADFRVHGIRFSPYGAVEFFYNGIGSAKYSWDSSWYTAGIEWPYKHVFMLNTYYRREHCSACVPEDWNAAGVSLNFFFRNER